jgi:hypothetical protein
MRRAVSGLGLIVAPYTPLMPVRIAVHRCFISVICADNNPALAPRNGNVAEQEVREPCLGRVLVCLSEDCHRETILLRLVGAERRGRTRGRLTLQTLTKQSKPAMRIA